MAPSAIDVEIPVVTKGTVHKPLELSGALNSYESFDVTPVIGREFPSANLVEWLDAPNSDELIRDLAITSESSAPEQHGNACAKQLQSRNGEWCSSVPRMA